MARQNQAVTETTQSSSKPNRTSRATRANCSRNCTPSDRLSINSGRIWRTNAALWLPSVSATRLLPRRSRDLRWSSLPHCHSWSAGIWLRSLFLSASEDSTAAEILIEQLATQGPLLTACANTALPLADRPWTIQLPLRDGNRLAWASQPSSRQRRASSLRLILVVRRHPRCRISEADQPHSLPDRFVSAGPRPVASGRDRCVRAQQRGIDTVSHGLFERGPAEFHLLDRETGPTTRSGRFLPAPQSRPNCQASTDVQSGRSRTTFIRMRLVEAGGVEVGFGDFDDVAEIVARASFQRDESAAGSRSLAGPADVCGTRPRNGSTERRSTA